MSIYWIVLSTMGKHQYKKIARELRKNNKLWAEGARESILLPHVPGYADALARGWCAERDYLAAVCNEYHALIPWDLNNSLEPPLPLPTYDSKAALPQEMLCPEEEMRKRGRINDLNKVKCRERYHVTRAEAPNLTALAPENSTVAEVQSSQACQGCTSDGPGQESTCWIACKVVRLEETSGEGLSRLATIHERSDARNYACRQAALGRSSQGWQVFGRCASKCTFSWFCRQRNVREVAQR